jgi:hypothetical protein
MRRKQEQSAGIIVRYQDMQLLAFVGLHAKHFLFGPGWRLRSCDDQPEADCKGSAATSSARGAS